MKITDIRIRLIPNRESKLKAVASITIDDCFVVHDIKVLEGNQGYFVSMPSRKTPEGEYKDVAHPINTPTREEINKLVLAKYEEELKARDDREDKCGPDFSFWAKSSKNNKTYIKEGKINEQNINKTRTYKYILVFSNDCIRLFSRDGSMLN